MYNLSPGLQVFNHQLSEENPYNISVKSIVNMLLSGEYDEVQVHDALQYCGLTNIESLKPYAMDYLISFAYHILEDDMISDEELYDFTVLKKVFRISERDFMLHKNFAVREILQQQFIRLYSDNSIDDGEAIQNMKLQSLFDLNYDEFEEMKRDEIIASLLQGAKPEDLDISALPKGFQL